MSESSAAISYLKPPPGSCWKWVDESRAVAWKGGETIAMRQELAAVIERLAPNGLPPFAAIVLLLAATRDNYIAACAQLREHAEQLMLPGGTDPASAAGVTIRSIGYRLATDTIDLTVALKRVADLPADLRRSLVAKATLGELVFERVTRSTNPTIAADIVDELSSAADPQSFDHSPPPYPAVRELVECIEALQRGLQTIDNDRLETRLRTGLDQVVKPAEEDVAPSRRVRQLLAELAGDPELSGLARVARNLIAAVQVPRKLHRFEHLPTGGVSDISNRGQPDHLLISELAHDDLTLAVRIAVKEALYVQRESPPREPPHRRVILIDTGLRTWGVPRVYATAVGLALAATGDAHGELAMFRPAGNEIVPIDLTNRDGLLGHLESLETHAHFADALPAFVAEVAKSADLSESFLITQEDVLDDPDFRAALATHDELAGFVATVARDGVFKLWSITPAGRTLLRQATLNIDQLVAPEPKRALPAPPPKPLVEASINHPLVLSVQPFPLRLPFGGKVRQIIGNHRDDIAAITHDRGLLVWNKDYGSGATTLIDHTPRGRIDLFAFIGDLVIAVFTETKRDAAPSCNVLAAALDGSVHPFLELTGLTKPPLTMFTREENIFVIERGRAVVYHALGGDPIASVDTTSYHWVHGRLFRREGLLYMLALTGSVPKFERMPEPTESANSIIDAVGFDGPLEMSRFGALRKLSGSFLLHKSLHEQVSFHSISRDGKVIIAETSPPSAPRRYHSIDLTRPLNWREISGPLGTFIDGTHRFSSPPQALRVSFYGVLIDPDGNLVLMSSDKRTTIKLVGANLELNDSRHRQDRAGSLYQFDRMPSLHPNSFRLRVAKWDNGSKVFLDSRGLLHLKSFDRSIPEVTIALCNTGPLAGWSSDGRVYGPRFFHGQDTSHDPRHLDDLIHVFTKSLA